MKQLTPLQLIRSPFSWSHRRLQQFADREGLSLLQAQVLEQMQDKHRFFNQQVDRVVDPAYRTENKPA